MASALRGRPQAVHGELRSPSLRRAFAAALRDFLKAHGAASLEATGGSMAPAIPAGATVDVVYMEAPPRVGDIVAFLHPTDSKVCCHRVIGVRRDGTLLTAGDHNPAVDGWIEFERQVGRIAAVRCAGGIVDPVWSAPSSYRVVRQRVARGLARLGSKLPAKRPGAA